VFLLATTTIIIAVDVIIIITVTSTDINTAAGTFFLKAKSISLSSAQTKRNTCTPTVPSGRFLSINLKPRTSNV
jgi:hypothetical protein